MVELPFSRPVLMVDTSAGWVYVSICQQGEVLFEQCQSAHMDMDSNLFQMLQQALEDTGLSFEEIGLYAVCCGPGSFTGSRVGIAALNTLALIDNTPIVGIDSLHMAAAMVEPSYQHSFQVALNCIRDEVFYADFCWKEQTCTRLSDIKASDMSEFMQQLGTMPLVAKSVLQGSADFSGYNLITPQLGNVFNGTSSKGQSSSLAQAVVERSEVGKNEVKYNGLRLARLAQQFYQAGTQGLPQAIYLKSEVLRGGALKAAPHR